MIGNNNMYGFIYITTDHTNGKKYIGQRKYDDKGKWKSYLGSGVRLNNEINSHGRENFTKEIIDEAESIEKLNELEIYYINLYDAVKSPMFYNIASGGMSANNFAGKSEEEIIGIRKKQSLSMIGKFVGKNNPNYGNVGNKNSIFGKPKTESHKNKISQSNKGNAKSESHKKKLSENHANVSGENNPMFGKTGLNCPASKSVRCITTNEIFDSITAGGIKYNINNSNITACCKGKRKYAGKHPVTGEKMVWVYYEDWLKPDK